MNAIKQLLRQPLKTVIGLLLTTIAAAVACLCVGQALAAQSTEEALNQRFSTVGIPLVQEDLDGNVTAASFLLEKEFQTWLEHTADEHPDIVKTISRHGILSAYVPALNPFSPIQEKYHDYKSPWKDYQTPLENMPYSCAMLVITLDAVSEPEPIIGAYPAENLSADDFLSPSDYYAWLYDDPNTEKMTAVQGYRVMLRGTVTDAVSLDSGYPDPVGRFAQLSLTVPALEEIYALNLTPGEQYIAYTMHYEDEHQKLISELNPNGLLDYLDLDNYDPEKLYLLSEEEKQSNAQWAEHFPELEARKYIFAVYNGIELTEQQYLQLNTVSLEVSGPVPLITYEEVRDKQTGRLLELRPASSISYITAEGETVICSMEEYANRYCVPTIALLSGTAEEFLCSAQQALWQDALERNTVNSHAFSFVGVEKMDYLADFSLKRSQIAAGRDFTQEELETGSRVCILHASLAQRSGISLGDTITVNFYQAEYPQSYRKAQAEGSGLLETPPGFYYETTPFLETAEYTVVGFWHGQQLWSAATPGNEYGFSPNTVFIPNTSVQIPMEKRDSILFNTLVLQNTQIEEFHQLAAGAGYAGRFKYNDQDYSTVAANFHNYDSLSKQVLAVGALFYATLLVLFLLLYPRALAGTVWTMQTLGAGFLRRFLFILSASLCIVLPAAFIGSWLGTQLWGFLAAGLQDAAQSAVSLEIMPDALTAVAAGQLIFALSTTLLTALFVAAPRGLSKRR